MPDRANVNIPKLTAFLIDSSYINEQLDSIHKSFERGACSTYNPIVELFIRHAPAPNATIKDLVKVQAPPFLVIDSNSFKQDALWYIHGYASNSDVINGDVENENVIWKIRVKTSCIPVTFYNYQFGNVSIVEDLVNCGVQFPINEHYKQPIIWDIGNWDVQRDVWITAEPHEIEYSSDNSKVKLKNDDLAHSKGLVNSWTTPQIANRIKLTNGQTHQFADGSVALKLKYNPNFKWPEYKRPEGSL